jgi:hypothetical protein
VEYSDSDCFTEGDWPNYWRCPGWLGRFPPPAVIVFADDLLAVSGYAVRTVVAVTAELPGFIAGLAAPRSAWSSDMPQLTVSHCRTLLDLARIWVRHEALLLRMEVRDRPSPRRRSGGVKLEAA